MAGPEFSGPAFFVTDLIQDSSIQSQDTQAALFLVLRLYLSSKSTNWRYSGTDRFITERPINGAVNAPFEGA